MGERTCKRPGCAKRIEARGFCSSHYKAARRSGELVALPRPTPEDIIWTKIIQVGDCWQWTGTNQNGYGIVGGHRKGNWKYCHRFSYELLRAEIPEGLHIDHLCRNKLCLNPWHLEPVTQRENNLRGMSPPAINARKTHCESGHEFTPENTLRTGPEKKFRTCKACSRTRPRVND